MMWSAVHAEGLKDSLIGCHLVLDIVFKEIDEDVIMVIKFSAIFL